MNKAMIIIRKSILYSSSVLGIVTIFKDNVRNGDLIIGFIMVCILVDVITEDIISGFKK